MLGFLMETLAALRIYYSALWIVLVRNGTYDDLRVLCGAPRVPFWTKYDSDMSLSKEEEDRLFSAIWLHSLSLTFSLWSVPHYRAPSLRDDLVANFSNIAFPGTGVPMSWVCSHKLVAVLYFVLLHPIVTLVAAYNCSKSAQHRRGRSVGVVFTEELLRPPHWFALWRINSTLVAAHHTAHEDRPRVQEQYRYENKWDFLQLALRQRDLPHASAIKVTPIIDAVPQLVCKHKNMEGGMGIHIFKNAAFGGDWILQQRLENCAELQALLPADAPLSTFRVITMADPTAESIDDRHKPMTFVWRAGRAGKNTDHSSVLFAVDPVTLRIQGGQAFSNWYQVGRPGNGNLLSTKPLTKHPDTGRDLMGVELSCARPAVDMCVEAHRRLMPDVPAIGWDVAVAEGHGPVLLEANLSCNFFGGTYDRQQYLRIVDTYYANECRGGPAGSDGMGKVGSSDAISDEAVSTITPPVRT